jgi:prepilin-type N-terminal cleavage/methylation domain-containing protein
MWKNGRIKIQAFSLVEIMISMAIFSFIFSIVTGIALILVRAQVRVQAQVFLTQTAQTTLENLSRNLRYGYAYLGGDRESYLNNYILFINNNPVQKDRVCNEYYDFVDQITKQTCSDQYTEQFNTQENTFANRLNSPFIVFESQGGNPREYSDQNSYCIGLRTDGSQTLYKLEKFNAPNSTGTRFEDRCDSTNRNALDMLPKGIRLEEAGFDVYGESAENPTNPMVRVRIKLSSEDGGTIYLQTSITQRLIQVL